MTTYVEFHKNSKTAFFKNRNLCFKVTTNSHQDEFMHTKLNLRLKIPTGKKGGSKRLK